MGFNFLTSRKAYAGRYRISAIYINSHGPRTAAMYKDDWIQSALDKSALYTLRAEET